MRVSGLQHALQRIATIERRFGSFQMPTGTEATPRQDPSNFGPGQTPPKAGPAEANQVFAATLGTPRAVPGLDELPGPGKLDRVAAADVLAPVVAAPREDAWHSRLPDAAAPFVTAIEDAAAAADLDPRLLASLVWQESGFVPDAVSHAGALGLAQLMPGTARALGVDPMDPAQNLAGGARFLKEQLDRFGSVDLALAAYNAGPGRVTRAGGIPNISETRAYVTKVKDTYEQLGGRP